MAIPSSPSAPADAHLGHVRAILDDRRQLAAWQRGRDPLARRHGLDVTIGDDPPADPRDDLAAAVERNTLALDRLAGAVRALDARLTPA